jgi:PAS domain S-box-containing protein
VHDKHPESEHRKAQQRILELEATLEEAEQKIAELRQSEAQLNATIESIPFQFFALDAGGRYVLQNTALREAWGDVIGKLPADLDADEATLKLWRDNNRRAMAGETVTGQVSWTTGGEEFTFHNVIAPVRLDDRIIGVLGVNIDITKLKRAEQALRESELKFRAIAENIPGVVFSYDQTSDGRRSLVYVGSGVENLIGKELTRKLENDVDSLFELIHPEDRPLVAAAGQDSPEFDMPVDIEFRFRVGAGEYRWVRSISRAVKLTATRKRWHVVLFDVTDKVRAKESLSLAKSQLEERVRERTAELEAVNERLRKEIKSHLHTTGALQQSEQSIRAVMDATSESIMLLDIDARILAINEAGARRFGFTPEQLLGRDIRTFMPLELARSRWAVRDEVLKTGKAVHQIDQRGERTYDSWFYPVTDSEGEVNGLAIFARDITDERRFEKNLKQLNLELQAQRVHLEQKNVALNELVRSVEEEKNTIKRQVQANVSRSILPLLSQLAMRVTPELNDLVNLLRRSLEDISGSFTSTLETKFPQLTPRELDVCRMVRNGLHSKEIAGLLSVSLRSVEKFRQSIRRKLRLQGKKQNLQTFLQSL